MKKCDHIIGFEIYADGCINFASGMHEYRTNLSNINTEYKAKHCPECGEKLNEKV